MDVFHSYSLALSAHEMLGKVWIPMQKALPRQRYSILVKSLVRLSLGAQLDGALVFVLPPVFEYVSEDYRKSS